MEPNRVDLSAYSNQNYDPGRGKPVRVFWYFANILFFRNPFCTSYWIKSILLKCFGARIGKKVVIKPRVNIKYPWKLEIGNHSWIGEDVWIDNLDHVRIGNHVCLSQGAMLLCGNHDYKKKGFDLMTANIIIEDGAWIGARSLVAPGCHVGSHAVLSAGSIASGTLSPYGIYRGNPASWIRERKIQGA